MKKHILLGIAALALFGFGTAHEANYKIAPGYSIKVSGADVEATFDSLSGNIRFAPEHLDNVLFDVTVSSASINTGIDLKNKHAQSAQWLDVEAFPEIRYKSTVVKQQANGFATFGELELHGLKQPVEIPFTFSENVFKGEFDLSRNDYQIGKPKSNVAPTLHVSLVVPVMPVH
jgi:polyisoprenoid-binding protein YceI